VKAVQAAGLELSPQQALQLSIFRLAAHEGAHGVDAITTALGNSTFKRGQTIEGDSIENTLRRDLYTVHREHLARGVERGIFPHALQEVGGYSDQQARAIIEQMRIHADYPPVDGHERAAYTEYLKQAQEKGLLPYEVRGLEEALQQKVNEKYGDEAEEIKQKLPDTAWHFDYRLEPYTPKDIDQLLAA
jgi:phosphatidylserine/phosphatidylglycerophosphate/cardiolipin synthase-like enzyme